MKDRYSKEEIIGLMQDRICELENYIEGFSEEEIANDEHCYDEIMFAKADISNLRTAITVIVEVLWEV